MRVVICAACRAVIGYVETPAGADKLALAHHLICPASPEEQEQAVIDMKFRKITEGLEL